MKYYLKILKPYSHPMYLMGLGLIFCSVWFLCEQFRYAPLNSYLVVSVENAVRLQEANEFIKSFKLGMWIASAYCFVGGAAALVIAYADRRDKALIK